MPSRRSSGITRATDMTFAQFWGAMSYILALYIAVMLVAWKMPRRGYFWLRVALCFACIVAYKYLFDFVLSLLELDSLLTLFIRTLDSFILYVLSACSVAACFKCNFWATLFCSTAGYCMQHMSQRTFVVLIRLAGSGNVYVNALLLSVITAAFYVAIYYLFIKKSEYSGMMLDNKVQVSVSFFAVLITVFLNSFAMYEADNRQRLYVMIFSALAAILIVYIEFGWLSAKKEAVQKNIIKHMLYNSQEQYKLEKEMVEVINMKVHDLKHRFAAGGGMSPGELGEMNETVQIYDSFYNTGNGVLDVVLTSKSLLCEKYGIQFTCLIDGKKLCFLTEEEIYSLFGNIMDNAIEAVNKLEQPEKRVISLSSWTDADGMLVIHEENYCSGRPRIVDGYPKTTKGDEYYHGFGVKSIGYIARKHRGHCKISFTDDIFEIDLIFPSGADTHS